MKALLYCTKGKPYLYQGFARPMHTLDIHDPFNYKWHLLKKTRTSASLNGKIVAECDFEVEEIIANDVNLYDEYGIKYTTKNGYSDINNNFEALLNNSCLNAFELNDYLGGCDGYAIHIKNLHIFDVPKDFSEYSKNVEHCKCDECLENCKKYCKYYYAKNNITQTINTGCIKYACLYKAPQNMMYVFDGEEKKVLISIHPEWLCKILNGEKKIEVRKKVLKEMIK